MYELGRKLGSMLRWGIDAVGSLLSKGVDAVKSWWKQVSFWDLALAAGVTYLVLPLEELALMLSVPGLATGIPQFDLLLGAATWLATVFLWTWVREVAVGLAFIGALKVVRSARLAAKRMWDFHKTRSWLAWILFPLTASLAIAWDLLGSIAGQMLQKFAIDKGEEHIKGSAPKTPYFMTRVPVAITKPKTFREECVIEEHFTPRSEDIGEQELLEAYRKYQKTGDVPQGFRVHQDLRIKMNGKVQSFAMPKGLENKTLVVDSTAGHGTKLMANKVDSRGICSRPGEYGFGISKVLDRRPVRTWNGNGHLHLLYKDDVFAFIPKEKKYLLVKKGRIPYSLTGDRTWKGKNISLDKTRIEEILRNPDYMLKVKYPDAMCKMIVDKDGYARIFSRRPMVIDGKVTDVPIEKTWHVPNLPRMKKYRNSKFEIGLVLNKRGSAIEREQALAAILNSYPAEVEGNIIIKLWRVEKLGKQDMSNLSWEDQTTLTKRISKDFRPNRKLFFHIPKDLPKRYEARIKALEAMRKAKEEGTVAELGDQFLKIKFVNIDTAKIIGVKRISTGAKAAGALIVEDMTSTGTPIPIKQVPGLPDLVLQELREWVWSKQDAMKNKTVTFGYEDTPEGQHYQTPYLIAIN